jgi:hypothetical protein
MNLHKHHFIMNEYMVLLLGFRVNVTSSWNHICTFVIVCNMHLKLASY